MARTHRKRRSKHRGTQGGRIDRRGRTSRPRSRQEARTRARHQYQDRRDRPPTWRSALNRALVAAAIFFALTLLLFGNTVPQAIAISLVMLLIYIPLSYHTDRFFYNRRQRQKQRQREPESGES